MNERKEYKVKKENEKKLRDYILKMRSHRRNNGNERRG